MREVLIDLEYTRRDMKWSGKKVPTDYIVQSLVPEEDADTWFFLSSNGLKKKEKQSKNRMWNKRGRAYWSTSVRQIGGDIVSLMSLYHGYHRHKDVPAPPMIAVTDSPDVLDRIFGDSFLNCEQIFVGLFMDAHIHGRDVNFLNFTGRHYGLNAWNENRVRDLSLSECRERNYFNLDQEEFFDPLT